MSKWGKLTVETCMRAGKTFLVTVIAVDIESVDSVHALEFLEAIEWHFTGSSDKLE